MPNADSTRWVKRFVELRRPYLHVHSVGDGEEVGVVSLRNARVDGQPGILGLLNLHGSYNNGGSNNHSGEGDAAGWMSPSSSRGRSPDPGSGSAGGRETPSHGGGGGGTGRLIASLWPGSGGGGGGGGGLGGSPNGGVSRLSERLQAGVFAVYGTDNTWLFAARSERDKMDWIGKIDQSFAMGSGSGSGVGSGAGSPRW